ncbi:hypothetical protein P5673_031305 [Acropora cervicornis]|uniref:Integrase core domain-containing protein n=1 Tax=Acropora cervicornis TaxID=6130 RepID=A0AAD9PT09_ACRCE|nr:hypothetical protein P5673_031305 [Acropora cervicornis]
MLSGCLLYFLVILAMHNVHAVLPPRVDTLTRLDRNSLIEHYFHLGFDYSEILGFLLLCHRIQISLRQLKRILSSNGLFRRRAYSSPPQVITAVERELRGTGSLLGYRQMHQRLRCQYGFTVDRESVRLILQSLDPDGVEQRSRRRLLRRQYHSKGPNYIRHIDGYDKLKPYGFCVHGAIDGYSRRIMWLEVGRSNNNPRLIASYFLACVKELVGVPRIIRGDQGTQNVNVAAIQRFFPYDDQDDFAGEKSFLYGRSVSNQRIEAWLGFLRRSDTEWWINFFQDLKDQGLYNETDLFQVECLLFCFMPVLQDELRRVVQEWNLHKIRPSSNESSPPGRPETLYFLPELTGTSSYLNNIKAIDIDVAEDVCCESPDTDVPDTFAELAQIIMDEKGLEMPSSPQSALNLYLELLSSIEDI